MCKKHMFFWILPIALLLVVGGCNSLQDKPAQNPLNSEPTLNPGDTLTTDDGRKEPMEAAAAAWWWNVNLNIWSRAMKDVGKTTGQSCKAWADVVVRDATGFSLPSTQSNWIYLNPVIWK